MVQPVALVVAGAFVLFGGIVLSRAREVRGRYATADGIEPADDGQLESGQAVTVSGPVHVSEPASPERTASEITGTGSPALWAWRVREKRGSGGEHGGTRWRTADGGLAVGEFAIDHGWTRVGVDTETLPVGQDDESTDPFDASELYIGEPDEEVYLGKLDPINRFLQRTGLASEDGALSDVEVTVSVGNRTNMPDKYQATVVREGDELLVRGELTETADGHVLRGTDETPLVIATDDLESQRDRLRSKARLRGLAGGVLVLLGVGVAALGVL